MDDSKMIELIGIIALLGGVVFYAKTAGKKGTSANVESYWDDDATNDHIDYTPPVDYAVKNDYAVEAYNIANTMGHPWPALFVAKIQAESNFNPNAVSPAGAQGIAQFMPATAKAYGIDPFEPTQAMEAAVRYDLDSVKRVGYNKRKVMAIYNCWSCRNKNESDWPTETKNYVNKIIANESKYT